MGTSFDRFYNSSQSDVLLLSLSFLRFFALSCSFPRLVYDLEMHQLATRAYLTYRNIFCNYDFDHRSTVFTSKFQIIFYVYPTYM